MFRCLDSDSNYRNVSGIYLKDALVPAIAVCDYRLYNSNAPVVGENTFDYPTVDFTVTPTSILDSSSAAITFHGISEGATSWFWESRNGVDLLWHPFKVQSTVQSPVGVASVLLENGLASFGTFSIRLTVQGIYGISVTKTKVDYFTIVPDPG